MKGRNNGKGTLERVGSSGKIAIEDKMKSLGTFLLFDFVSSGTKSCPMDLLLNKKI